MVRRTRAFLRRCTIPVLHEVYSESVAVDAHNNPIEGWAPPVEVRVFGWEPPKSTEPVVAGHDRVIVELLMYAPQSMNAQAHDRVRINGKQYEVIGEDSDPNNNPFFIPGMVSLQLRRVEG